MKKTFLLILIILYILTSIPAIFAEDYQYQYFNNEKDKYTPFSDYIPRIRKHYYTVPHFLEDYYQLYSLKQHYNENTLRKNIARLKTALNSKFRHPSQALVKISTKDEYYKYRNLMFMHINLLIMRSYLKIGARFDKRRIYWYDLEEAKMLKESLDVAHAYYKDALPYWKKAVKYAKKASKIKITTDLGKIESERFSIITGELNFKRIIGNHIKRVKSKQAKLKKGMQTASR